MAAAGHGSAAGSNTAGGSAAAEHYKCINERLEGKTHPKTGVPYSRKTVSLDGKTYSVCGPDFPSPVTIVIPESMRFSSDGAQFKECNRQLYEQLEGNPELRNIFSDRQIRQLADGDTPSGYTWDHMFECCHIRLVNSWAHSFTDHTGGRSFWGGGKKCR